MSTEPVNIKLTSGEQNKNENNNKYSMHLTI